MQYIGAGFSPRANIILVRLALHVSLHSQWHVLLHLLLHRMPLLRPARAVNGQSGGREYSSKPKLPQSFICVS